MKWLLGISFIVYLSALGFAQPFTCNGDFILSLSNQGPTSFYRLDHQSSGNVEFQPLSTFNSGNSINAIGYNTKDNYVYGVEPNRHELYRIDASGQATFVTELDLFPQTIYWAGTITPDGDHMLLIGKSNGWICTCAFSIVNLNDYSVESTYFPNGFPGDVTITDIAFDPVSGELYGFDGIDNRFVIIDPVNAKVDETIYPVSEEIDGLGAIFFDSFGDLYGYGNRIGSDSSNTLFKIDKETGLVISEAKGPATTNQDGCACSNNVDLRKQVFPGISYPCNEVEYLFEIVNTSTSAHDGISFQDILPSEFTIMEIVRNPFGGTIVSGVGTNSLFITDMSIPRGLDSLIVRVAINEFARGIYDNQARLENLPETLGAIVLSDDPETLVRNDPTRLFVVPLRVDLKQDTVGLCDKDTLVLDATTEGVTYAWENGSEQATRKITEAGSYYITVTKGCASASDTIVVLDESLTLELGDDLEVLLGDSIFILPDLVSYGNLTFEWSDPLINSVRCPTCPSTFILPTEDATYSLRITDEYGCTVEDDIHITIQVDRDLYIPNAFSPNNDGVNDVFYIHGDNFALIDRLQVFNRWGGRVFERYGGIINDVNTGWDGKFRGQMLNPGIYIYQAEVSYADGAVISLKGLVTLYK